MNLNDSSTSKFHLDQDVYVCINNKFPFLAYLLKIR